MRITKNMLKERRRFLRLRIKEICQSFKDGKLEEEMKERYPDPVIQVTTDWERLERLLMDACYRALPDSMCE